MPAGPRLLVIEDDRSLREALAAALAGAGYQVEALPDGVGLPRMLETFRPDLTIIDVGLPGQDGFTLAKAVRAASGIPVVFVTAADGVEDRLRGFEAGADDYVVKPFSTAEVLARVRAVLRRTGRLTSSTLELRDLVIDEVERVVLRGSQRVDLTPTEIELLLVLARNPDTVFSKVQLLARVWGFDQYPPNLVEVHVSSLRRKLEAHGPRLIHTERGAGYVLRA